MRIQKILDICIKVIGIYYLVKTLNMIPETIYLFMNVRKFDLADPATASTMFGAPQLVIFSILSFVFFMLLAIGLLVWSERISKYLYPEDVSEFPNLPDEFSKIAFSVCVKVIGLLTILAAIPKLSYFLSRIWIWKENLRYYDANAKIELTQSAISAILFIGVGLILIRSSEKVSGLLNQVNKTSEN